MIGARMAGPRSDEHRLMTFIQPEWLLFMLIGAFIDESGTHQGAPVTTMGAYLFKENHYKRFIDEWTAALKDRGNGIRYFHTQECAHLTGEFKRVGMTRKESHELYRYLVVLIKRRARIGVAVSAIEADFQAVKPQWATYSFYTYLAQCLTSGISDWAVRRKFAGRISYIFENGHESQNEADRGLGALGEFPVCREGSRYYSHAFLSKKDSCGLQAADILAYEWYQDRKNQIEGSLRRRRKSLLALGEGKLHVNAHFSREMIATHFKQVREIKRGMMDGTIDLGIPIKGWIGPDPDDFDDDQDAGVL